MVGLGETRDELQEAFEALRENDVDILTIGQYLRPSTASTCRSSATTTPTSSPR